MRPRQRGQVAVAILGRSVHWEKVVASPAETTMPLADFGAVVTANTQNWLNPQLLHRQSEVLGSLCQRY
jgi:hypothetical protein